MLRSSLYCLALLHRILCIKQYPLHQCVHADIVCVRHPSTHSYKYRTLLYSPAMFFHHSLCMCIIFNVIISFISWTGRKVGLNCRPPVTVLESINELISKPNGLVTHCVSVGLCCIPPLLHFFLFSLFLFPIKPSVSVVFSVQWKSKDRDRCEWWHTTSANCVTACKAKASQLFSFFLAQSDWIA